MAVVPKAPPSAFPLPGVNSEARLSVSVTVERDGGKGMRWFGRHGLPGLVSCG